jgi:putative membrane protein insertion efficiency factor
VVGRLLALLFGLWRATIGLLLPDACRFTPTCTHYAQEAVLRRGPFVGLCLTVWRVLRCQPFSRGGYDPVIRSTGPCRRGSSGLRRAAGEGPGPA